MKRLIALVSLNLLLLPLCLAQQSIPTLSIQGEQAVTQDSQALPNMDDVDADLSTNPGVSSTDQIQDDTDDDDDDDDDDDIPYNEDSLGSAPSV